MKTAVFIDGNHLFFSLKTNGVEIDYARLLKLVGETEGTPHKVFFYTGVDKDSANADKQGKFFYWLRRNGFTVVTKQVETQSDGSRSVDFRVELVTDLIHTGAKMDTVVLVSGVDDYAYPMRVLSASGVRTVLMAFEGLASGKLIEAADVQINLRNHIDAIKKDTLVGQVRTPRVRRDHRDLCEDDFVLRHEDETVILHGDR